MAKPQSADSSNLVFGINAVSSLLKKNAKDIGILYVLLGKRNQRVNDLMEVARKLHIRVERVGAEFFDQKVPDGVHQGVLAETQVSYAKDEAFLDQLLEQLQEPAFLLVLDGVTDPHNIGACLRTADAAGVHAVIAPKDKSGTLNSTAVKVACGAAENTPFVSVTNLARCLKKLQDKGIWITGTAGEATTSIYQTDLTGPAAIVMGAEGKGMRRLTREACDNLTFMPMAGEVSSLNVSVATGVILFEAVRQRSLKV
jgi:23S rRNA (guanosine2251-2'-O)-methyltransferase